MKSEKIFIEGLGLVEGHFSGIGQYILGMVRGFDEIIEEAKQKQLPHPEVYVVIPYNTLARFKSFNFKHVKAKRLPFNFNFLNAGWITGTLPPIDLFCGRGHYIFTRFVRMPLAFSESSQIVYDLSFELHPEFGDEPNVLFLSRGTRASVEKAKHVFAISENGKREIVKFYDIPKEKVVVGYPGVDQRYFFKRTDAEIGRVKDKYNIRGDYIIALSNLEPRKNLDALIDAYCAMDKKFTDHVGLLIVGVTGWKTEALFDKIIEKVEQGYNIMRPSQYVDDSDKPAIISGAKMLVYPSHYEGFGIPPVEALACGIPVIAADNSSLPEAVGDVGQLVNEKDVSSITRAMTEILNDWEARSEAVRKSGPVHASQFNFKKTSRAFLATIRGDKS